MSITGTPKPQMSYENKWKPYYKTIRQYSRKGLVKLTPLRPLCSKLAVTPKFCKAKSVHFALQTAGTVERELDRLESEGILERVAYNKWEVPIVSVPKPEGAIRICGDYKITINPQLEVDQYPLPKPDTIFSTLSDRKWFSKIDLTHAYQ